MCVALSAPGLICYYVLIMQVPDLAVYASSGNNNIIIIS